MNEASRAWKVPHFLKTSEYSIEHLDQVCTYFRETAATN